MNEAADNPYSTPDANITPEPGDSDAFADFPRFSAWWVFLIGTITAGIYYYYWLYTRTSKLNEVCTERPLSTGLVLTLVVIGIANTVLSYWPEIMLQTSPETLGLFALVVLGASIVTMVLYFMVVFGMRSRFNQLTGAVSGTSLWTNGILTFFFGPIYLAYKINQIKDVSAGMPA